MRALIKKRLRPLTVLCSVALLGLGCPRMPEVAQRESADGVSATNTAAAQPTAAAPSPASEEDLILPGPGRHRALRDARVTVLRGSFQRLRGATAAQPLRLGDRVPRGAQLRGEGPEALLELTFADQTVLRAGEGSHLTLPLSSRAVLLRAGAALVQADRMLGGVTLLTPGAACVTEGTTYLARVSAGGEVVVEVHSGVVQVVRPGDEAQGPGRGGRPDPAAAGRVAGLAEQRRLPAQARLVVAGERVLVPRAGAPLPPTPLDLSAALLGDPLLRAEGRLELGGLRGLADQQRRGVLARYGERLRREIRWQRHREPITLPPLFQPGAGDEAPPRVAGPPPGPPEKLIDSAPMSK